MAKMTFLDAAVRVLREAGGGPLHYSDIARRAIERQYVSSAGKTPGASFGAQLYVHVNRAEAGGLPPKVRLVGKGLFALPEPGGTRISKSVDEWNEQVRAKLFEHVREMAPKALEKLVAALLSEIGFENVAVTSYSADGGLDVEAELTVGGVSNVKTAVQVKRWKSKVSGKTVRELRGSLTTDQRGLIITTSSFTRDARNEAEAGGKTPISLVNGEKLIELLVQHGIGISRKSLTYLELDIESLDELAQEEGGGGGKKRLGIWPLPGGIREYVGSAVRMLQHIARSEPSQAAMVDWICEDFERVRSRKTAAGYIGVLRTLGLASFEGETLLLTDAGKDALANEPKQVILRQLMGRVAGVEEYLKELRSRSMSLAESNELLKSVLDVSWETTAQARFRLRWLENTGAVRKKGERYTLTDEGRKAIR